jgi:hypothetical protein
MKLLFIARHYTYFRNYDSALRELAARGHQIHLAVEVVDKLGAEAAVAALARECPGITYGMVPPRQADSWSGAAQGLRLGLDYLRYLEPFYDTAPLRRVRAHDRTPRLLLALAHPPLLSGAIWRRIYGTCLHWLDAFVPPPASVVDFVREHRADAVLVTPLVDLGSQQIDYVRAARLLGIPSCLPVWSWDHLTSKAYLRDRPQRVLVWNETQRREAVDVHGVPEDRVVVTGAQCFDHWFTRTNQRTREAFCAELGFDSQKPIVLYVCTGLIKGSPREPQFVREWLDMIRASGDPILETCNVLVRPHPAQTEDWQDVDLSAFAPVAVSGGNPVDERTRTDYFDALYHSAAVVGLNTSAFIEAGIVGREVLTILEPRYHDNQEGTAHFQYLLQIGGGLLRVGRDRPSHVAQLGEALRRPVTAEHPHKAFLEAFVRPRGLTHAATPDFVSAVEGVASCRVAPAHVIGASWRRAAFGRIAQWGAGVAGESLVSSPRELAVIVRDRQARAVKQQREDEARVVREAAKATRRLDRERELAEHRAARAAQEAQKKAMRQAR